MVSVHLSAQKTLDAFSHRDHNRFTLSGFCVLFVRGQFVVVVEHHLSNERSYSMFSLVCTQMDNHLQVGIPPRSVTKPTRSTQPCIPLGSLN